MSSSTRWSGSRPRGLARERAGRTRAPGSSAALALVLGLGAGAAGCRTESASASSEATPTAGPSLPAPPVQTSGADRKRALDSLHAPPPEPPAEARTSAGGVRWVLLAGGVGAPPGPDSSVTAEVTAWTRDGRLAYTSYADGGAVTFDLRALPSGFRRELAQLPPGSRARFWMPASALAGWKPGPWPSEDLIVDYELLKWGEASTVRVLTRDGVVLGAGAAFPAPLAGPPPVSAGKTPEGISHLELRPGQGPAAGARATLKLRLDAWSLSGSSVSRVLQGQELSMRVDSAPDGLRSILLSLRAGGAHRVWIPAELAQSILPAVDGGPTVLDIELLEIRS